MIGSGGRESALAWKLAQSEHVSTVFVTNHPAASELSPKIISTDLTPEALALQETLVLAVVGPEVPLSEGLADRLRALGVPTVGPSAAAAQLECSKDFAKTIMLAAGVPTADSQTFSQLSDAQSFLSTHPNHLVVKVDGPAQGKGVVVAADSAQALAAVEGFFNGSILGFAAQKLVIEEKLTGPELSAFALCNGQEMVWLGSARDHKRLLANDLGPNTGGMGTVAPLTDLSVEERSFIEERIFLPVLREMKKRGHPFQGFLFAGLMRTPAGLQALEFNVRLGDPETQVLLPLLQGDFFQLLLKCTQGQLPPTVSIRGKTVAVHVVMAAPGYPGIDGETIRLGDAVNWQAFPQDDVVMFPAGLTGRAGEWKTRGGRVMGVTAWGADLEKARALAYQTVNQFAFTGCQWREDIGMTK